MTILDSDEFNQGNGIHRYKNQKALETNPINYENDCMGFQTKVYDTPLSKNKGELKKCIKKAKETYPELTKIVFYIYKEYNQSSDKNQNKPKYITEIEEYGNEKSIKVIWRVRSELERMLQEPENILLYYIFFNEDFNGIQTLESFTKKSENKTRPDLKNNYLKIDSVHDNLMRNIEDNRITSISGRQTIGKTRLAIEVAKQLANEKQYNIIIIDFPDNNLIINLKKIIRTDKQYLIIFDNYTSNYPTLYNIIDELWNYGDDIDNIKFIFTLKNQYLTSLKEELNDFKLDDFPLDTISDQEMRKIIANSSNEYGFTLNNSTIHKIIGNSKGNIGICLMAMKLIMKGSFDSISNYEDIYKFYFNNRKLNKLHEKSKKVLGIVSFFESIDLNNESLINEIKNSFNIDLFDEIELLEDFSNDEILDWNQNIIYFSDSILSTYVFYLIFIDEELLSLHELIINFIENQYYLLTNRIYDVLSIFGKKSIEKLKISQLNPAKDKLDGNNLDLFYIIFYNIYVDEITLYLKKWIESFEDNLDFNRTEFKIPDRFRHIIRYNKIILLSRLFYTENQIYGLNLVIDLILKKQALTESVLYSLKENYSYKISSIENDFEMENSFLDFIESDFDENKRVVVDNIYLFLLSQNRFFSLMHTQSRQTTKPYESEIFEVRLPPSKSWRDLRTRLLINLFNLYDKYPIEVEDVFEDYLNNFHEDFYSLYENEEELVFKFLARLNYKQYKANKLAYLYLKKMKECSANLKNNYDFIDAEIIEYISSYSNILADRHYHPEYHEKVYAIIENLKINKHDYKYAFSLMKDIEAREDRCNTYCDELFSALLYLDFNIFVEAYKYYMSQNFGIITSYGFVKILASQENENLDCYHLINNQNYIEQNMMNFVYFQHLHENNVNETVFNYFIDFIKISPSNINFLMIERYLKFDNLFHTLIKDDTSNIIQYIVKITIPHINENTNISIHNFCKENERYFKDNFELLKEFYLKNNLRENTDYDFSELQILCEKNKEFLFEYFQHRLRYNDEFYREHRKIDFIWDLDYEFKEIEDLINYINDNYDYVPSEAVNLIFMNENPRETEFIKYYIKNNTNNKKYIQVIFEIIKFNYSPKEYTEFLKEFLMLNDDYETFKLIMAPYFLRKLFNEKAHLEGRIKFFEQIKDMLSEMKDSRKYIKHKLYLSDKISEIEEKLRNKDYW